MLNSTSKGVLALSDGQVFYGTSVGAKGYTIGELVFNTSMTGYQEIFSDPSYLNQIIVMTTPHIGNVGVNQEDMESSGMFAKGVIVRDIPRHFSSWRGQRTLSEFLEEQKVIALMEIDTRRLTQHIRRNGSLKAYIGTLDAVQERPHVLVINCGVKTSLLKCLEQENFRITIVEPTDSFLDILRFKPDGIVLSNGPGNPNDYADAIELTQKILRAQIPFFGICLGHQIFALASGASIEKMPFGQHGGNHPIIDDQNRVLISCQNHQYTVSHENLPKHLKITHRSLQDNSICGLRSLLAPAFSFQGHPESGPGPNDFSFLFKQFKNLILLHAKAN